MSEHVTRGGHPWVPMYIETVNEKKCIGCGRCNKVCGHGVLGMKGLTEDGDECPIDDEEMERIVTTIVHPENCIGCHACGMVCGAKGAQTHVSAAV
jgi:Nif-specific ferredoxin III